MAEVIPLVSHHGPAHRLRVLCFHSFRTSAAILRRQLFEFSNVGTLLEEFCDLDFIDGAHECDASDEAKMEPVLKQFFKRPFFEWVNASQRADGTREYAYLDASLRKIAQAVAQRGPYDGFLGFSQGGTMAHTCVLLAAHGQLRFAPPRFLLIFSARVSRHHEHVELMEREPRCPLRVPALVVYNGDDDHVAPDETRRLVATLQPPPTEICLAHERGHAIRRLSSGEAERFRAFFRSLPPPPPRSFVASLGMALQWLLTCMGCGDA